MEIGLYRIDEPIDEPNPLHVAITKFGWKAKSQGWAFHRILCNWENWEKKQEQRITRWWSWKWWETSVNIPHKTNDGDAEGTHSACKFPKNNLEEDQRCIIHSMNYNRSQPLDWFHIYIEEVQWFSHLHVISKGT